MRRKWLVVCTVFCLLSLFSASPAFAYDSGSMSGNDVTPLIDGNAIFNQVNNMINSAQKAIHVEMYEFQQTSIADKLIAKKRAGVEVQVILDPSSSTIGTYLQNNGVPVLYYPQSNQSYIDHVKLLVVDGNQALMGGMNWGTNSPNNHDADLLIKGPAANNLNDIFVSDWQYSGGTSSYTTSTPLTTSGNDSIDNATTFHYYYTTNADIKPHVLDLINYAYDHVYIEMYDLTDSDVINALINAKNYGVDVRVLLDPNQSANHTTYNTLLANGVKVAYYPVQPGQKLHMKMGVADGVETVIGSCNWSNNGFYHNHELDSDVVGSDTASVFENMFYNDWVKATGSW
jgi:cardiolipin synthase